MSHLLSQEFADLDAVASRNARRYRSAKPFPSITFDGFFAPAALDAVLSEFPDLSVKPQVRYESHNELAKYTTRGEARFGPETRALLHFLNSEPFLAFVQRLTGIDEPLLPDPYFNGGGLHEIKPGGLLKVHADFNKHPETKLDRRVNVLVYLNKDWREEYGGHFELWDRAMTKPEVRILPLFNRLAMFSTTSTSYHGHPDPLTCPPGRSRKSIALYYYTNGRPAHEVEVDGIHTTLFRGRDEHEQRAIDAASDTFSRRMDALLLDMTPPIVHRTADRWIQRLKKRMQ